MLTSVARRNVAAGEELVQNIVEGLENVTQAFRDFTLSAFGRQEDLGANPRSGSRLDV